MKYRLERGDQPVNKVDALALHHDMRYDAYDGFLDRFNADVHFIVGAAGIVLSPTSSWRERGEALFTGGIMTTKVIMDTAFNPIKKLSMLKRFSKSAKEFQILKRVM